MAITPRARAASPSAEENFYAENDQDPTPGTDDGGQGGAGGDEDPADTTLNPDDPENAGGEAGDPQDLDPDDDDFFVAPPRRGEHRQQSLANENRDLRRQLDQLRGVTPSSPANARPVPQQTQIETDDQFEARIQLLEPGDRMEARYKRDRQIMRMEQQQQRVETALLNDRTQFETKALTDKRYARWADRVKAEVQRRLAQGQIVSHEDTLKWMLGDRLVNGDEEPVKRERARARERVDRNTTRPVRAGSDVGRQPRRGALTEAEARRRRLEGQQI